MDASSPSREIMAPETAYHEAGHLVFAHMTGICIVRGLTGQLAPNQAGAIFDHDLALVAARANAHPEVIDHNLELAIIAAAGYAAQERYVDSTGQPVDQNRLFQHAHGDIGVVQELLGKARWKDTCNRARRYLDEPGVWQAITAVAQAALKHGDLPGNKVEDLVHAVFVEFNRPDYTVLC